MIAGIHLKMSINNSKKSKSASHGRREQTRFVFSDRVEPETSEECPRHAGYIGVFAALAEILALAGVAGVPGAHHV